VNEIPHRLVIDLEPAPGQFGDESAQGKIFFRDPQKQKAAMLANDRFRLVPAHLARQNAAGFSEAADPIDHRADPDGKMRGCLAPRHAALQNRRDNPLSKIA
jgi:hypothetical protein